MKPFRIAMAVVAGFVATFPAWASSVPIPVPEPGVLELLTASGVAGLVVWVRNRRK